MNARTGVLIVGSGVQGKYTRAATPWPADDEAFDFGDPDGRVRAWPNLYLAGNGVIPTAMAAHVTLTGAVTAVRAARAVRTASREETRA
jgi:choline dehydrogenase-like flavoprotein